MVMEMQTKLCRPVCCAACRAALALVGEQPVAVQLLGNLAALYLVCHWSLHCTTPHLLKLQEKNCDYRNAQLCLYRVPLHTAC